MTKTSTFLLGIVLLLGATATASAQPNWRAAGAVEDGDPRVEVELVLDHVVAQPGETVRAGAHVRIDPEWHVYWRNSGESGLSTAFTVDSGLSDVGPLRWPAPRLFVDTSGQIATFGYADEVLFERTGTVPDDATGSIEVVATIDYLACKVDCIPGRHELRRTIEIGAPQAAEYPFALANQRPKTPAEAGLEVEVAFDRTEIHPGESFEATVAFRCAGSPDSPTARDCSAKVEEAEAKRYTLIPDVTPGIDWKTTSVRRIDGSSVLTLAGRATNDGFDAPCELAGVVWVGSKTRVAVELRAEIECSNDAREDTGRDTPNSTDVVTHSESATAASGTTPAQPPGGSASLLYILFLALFGGMILNLMPCVFPVLAIKVFSFVKLAHENRANVYKHSLAYTSGIVGSMLALAAVVIGFKAAGNEVGWGFQFQEPLFVALLATALVLFACNLFGVFEVTLGTGGIDAVQQAEHGLGRSFGEGVLAVVLATPCSAPFLGTAVGFAFGADAATIVAVFAVLGLGLALPFVVLTAVPAWAKLLPKPGPWMVTFKQLLGFALLGTCVWLIWVLGRTQPTSAVVDLLTFLVATALAAWVWGKVQWLQAPQKIAALALALSVLGIVGWWALDFDDAPEPTRETTPEKAPESRAITGGPSTWSAYDADRVRSEVAAGRIVFVDFTADWCITCKVNERGVLSDEETLQMFRDRGVVPMVADWTRRDDEIRRVLARHGKAGVPMYLVFAPGSPDTPEVLPELLTLDRLRESLDRARPEP